MLEFELKVSSRTGYFEENTSSKDEVLGEMNLESPTGTSSEGHKPSLLTSRKTIKALRKRLTRLELPFRNSILTEDDWKKRKIKTGRRLHVKGGSIENKNKHRQDTH